MSVRAAPDVWTQPEPPARVRMPMLVQAWRECVFLHWRLEPRAVRPLVPPVFELDTFEGSAWVSLIAFDMPKMRPGGLPPIPGLASAAEAHIRTYVRGPDGRRGIWMTSLAIDPLQAAILGRVPFTLPYWWASMVVARDEDVVRYRVERRAPKKARLDLDLRIGEPYEDHEPTALDHFVTARWVLYAGVAPLHAALLVEHPRWPLRRASVERLEESLTTSDGLSELGAPDLVHFSDGVDARLGFPRPARPASR